MMSRQVERWHQVNFEKRYWNVNWRMRFKWIFLIRDLKGLMEIIDNRFWLLTNWSATVICPNWLILCSNCLHLEAYFGFVRKHCDTTAGSVGMNIWIKFLRKKWRIVPLILIVLLIFIIVIIIIRSKIVRTVDYY
jgi:hypothetical protein